MPNCFLIALASGCGISLLPWNGMTVVFPFSVTCKWLPLPGTKVAPCRSSQRLNSLYFIHHSLDWILIETMKHFCCVCKLYLLADYTRTDIFGMLYVFRLCTGKPFRVLIALTTNVYHAFSAQKSKVALYACAYHAFWKAPVRLVVDLAVQNRRF